MDELNGDLKQRRHKGLYRRRHTLESPQGVVTRIDGREVKSFCSNDYLGLANHPDIRQAMIDAINRYGVGSGSAHLVNGHGRCHQECEQRLAEFTGRDRALLFSTGYMANLAITSALVTRRDTVFQDKLNHASLIDAAQLSKATYRRYPHNDLARLQYLIKKSQEINPEGRRLIMTDAVFSMDGDCAPLTQMSEICAASNSWLMVDDAHGFGVLGENGSGLSEQENLNQKQLPVLMATLGKAVGVSGAFVAGSEALIETLIQRSRSYIYTTALPPAIAAAVSRSLQIIEQESWRRDKLLELIAYFKTRAQAMDITVMPSLTAIQPILIGDNFKALEISERLFSKGFHVVAIRPPTVPTGTARLRVTLCAEHKNTDIDQLLSAIKSCLV